MIITTLKYIKNYNAEDITTNKNYKRGLEVIFLSRGVYGMNGAVLKDDEGNYYKIVSRCSNLFRYV